MSADEKVLNRAIDTHGVHCRSQANQQFGSANFDLWTSKLVKSVMPLSNVMDICCGTGNQLILYARMNGVRELVGVDASQESLDVAQERLSSLPLVKPAKLICARMEDVFSDARLNKIRFDLISCFYGLYYTKNIKEILAGMDNHLAVHGKIMIVGPYGENNSALFDLLERHMELPDLVKRSSSTFMTQEVLPCFQAQHEVRTDTFVNHVRYPTSEAVMNYWKASTFYEPDVEPAVENDVKAHFIRHSELIVEKHVMAVLASKTAERLK